MPPSRRQPRITPPVRRPRVAGTRKPAADAPSPTPRRLPSPGPRPAPQPRPAAPDDDSPTTVFDAVAVEPEATEVAEPETAGPETDSGVLDDPEVRDSGLLDDSEVRDAELLDDSEWLDEPEPVDELEPPEVSGAISGDLKPSPRRKLRDTGIHKPVSFEAAEAEAAEAAAKPAPVKRPLGRNPYLLAGALVVVGLLLAGAAVLFKINANEISSATSNTALLDVAKTAQVKDQVSKAAETLFSYDFNNIAKTENAAKDLLVGDEVRAKYDNLMGEVKRLAPAQKMVVTSRVTRSGVIMLNGDLAKVMVFIDQTSTRTDTKQTAAGSAQLHLNAQLQGDKWKITDMDTYIAPAAPVAPASPSAPPPSK